MKTSIVARPGSKSSPKEIKKIAALLREVERRRGTLTPQIVLEESYPEESGLHKYFQWDNDKAAESYRIWQARMLIAKVYVIDGQRPEIGPVRAFVNVDIGLGEDDENDEIDYDPAGLRAYVSITRLKNRKDFESQLLAYAMQQLMGWKRRFGDYKAFLGVVEEIDKIKL